MHPCFACHSVQYSIHLVTEDQRDTCSGQGRSANLQGVALELAAGEGLHADGTGVVLEGGRAVDGQGDCQNDDQACA